MKVSKKLLLKLVKIEWVDSSTGAGWITYEGRDISDDNSLPCCSAGWVIAVTDDAVTVSSNITGMWTENFQFHSTMTIPVCAVRKVTVLK